MIMILGNGKCVVELSIALAHYFISHVILGIGGGVCVYILSSVALEVEFHSACLACQPLTISSLQIHWFLPGWVDNSGIDI